MVIKQVNVTQENLFEMCQKDNLYIVRMTEHKTRHPMPARPYGLSFASFTKDSSIKQVLDVLNGNCAVVEVVD